ncbi:unnamed protein product [Mycena citricolor]|uniref:UBX domain-containing protein n=1 Tax=Mycena citricolor TaxID=2018698 RepID=A0AAD2H6Q2_9AGAR|nr:unnamed protein product [Mycena citricolor]
MAVDDNNLATSSSTSASDPVPIPSVPSSSDAPAVPDFKVYKPSSSNAPPLREKPVLPDEYFTPTAADLQSAQATLSSRTQALNDAPLQFRAEREAAAKAKRERWPSTTIRIRFTDRTQLEKVFPSSSKIRAVYAFVRGSLREDVKPVKFVLYQPPKRDLKVSDAKVRDLTLADLQLAPASVLLLRFEDADHESEARALNGISVAAPLVPEIMQHAIDLPAPPPAEASTTNTTSANLAASASKAAASIEKKIPKWLKMGKK